jgi:lysophospholipase
MKPEAARVPVLESRFLEPEGWRWGFFTVPDGAILRYGSLSPANPDAVIVTLPGRSEFIEKYFETAKELQSRNYAVWVLDWRGQGKSGRFLPNRPQRCHVPSFDFYADDLQAFLSDCVKPAAGNTPLIMLAHSMGGHIGLLHLYKFPSVFKAAALCAPMLGLKFQRLPDLLALTIAWIFNLSCSEIYAFGQKDWSKTQRTLAADALTSDPARGVLHDSWMEADPELRLRGVTFGWVYQALASCRRLRRRRLLESVRTPCLIALPERERLVDDSAARRAARILPRAEILDVPGAGHEILMETDSARTAFLDAFTGMVRATLKQG